MEPNGCSVKPFLVVAAEVRYKFESVYGVRFPGVFQPKGQGFLWGFLGEEEGQEFFEWEVGRGFSGDIWREWFSVDDSRAE